MSRWPAHTMRCVCVAVSLCVADHWAWALLADPTRHAAQALGHWRTLDAVTAVAGASVLLLTLAVLALSVSTAVTVADALTGSRIRPLATLAQRGTPAAWRRAVLVACAAGLCAPAPALAVDGSGSGTACSPRCEQVAARTLDGLRLPEWPAAPHRDRPQSRPAPPEPAMAAAPKTVVVQRGDCLWAIAERLLPTDADLAGVAALTTAIYAQNRAVIGPDPDLVFPGMRLTVPEGRS